MTSIGCRSTGGNVLSRAILITQTLSGSNPKTKQKQKQGNRNSNNGLTAAPKARRSAGHDLHSAGDTPAVETVIETR